MPYTTDYTEIENYKDVIYEDDPDRPGNVRLKVKAEAIIFGLLPMGFCEITEQNATEVYARFALYERMFGSLCFRWDGEQRIDEPITPEDIRSFVGLRTNASVESPEAWRNRMTKACMNELRAEYRHAIEKGKVTA